MKTSCCYEFQKWEHFSGSSGKKLIKILFGSAPFLEELNGLLTFLSLAYMAALDTRADQKYDQHERKILLFFSFSLLVFCWALVPKVLQNIPRNQSFWSFSNDLKGLIQKISPNGSFVEDIELGSTEDYTLLA